MEPLQASAHVDAPPERAFEVVHRADGGMVAQGVLVVAGRREDIGIEPRPGGFAYERGPHGFQIHWGRVLAWEPPQRLVFTWQIAGDRSPQPDPDKASEVEVRFSPAQDGGTDVALEHRDWERHGGGAREYRDGFEQAGAWPYALERLAAAAR